MTGEEKRLWLRLGLRLGLGAAAFWLAKEGGPVLLSLLGPFLAAALAAAGLDRPVGYLQDVLGLPRWLVTLVLLLALLALVGGGSVFLLYEAGKELLALLQNWDSLLSGVERLGWQLGESLQRGMRLTPPVLLETAQELAGRILNWVGEAVPAALGGLAAAAGQTAKHLPGWVVAVLVFGMTTYFFTSDYPHLRTRLLALVGEKNRRVLRSLRGSALGALGGYLRAQALLSVGVFFLLLGGFVLTGQDYALLLALGLAVLDFIPVVGAGTVMVPWAGVALLARQYPTAIRVMVIWGVIALFRRLAEPRVLGEQTGLSPVASLASVYVGMRLGGVPGMIFGPVVLLVILQLADMGMFRGAQRDVQQAARALGRVLQRPEGK